MRKSFRLQKSKYDYDLDPILVIASIIFFCSITVFVVWMEKNTRISPSPSPSTISQNQALIDAQKKLLGSLKITFPLHKSNKIIDESQIKHGLQLFIVENAQDSFLNEVEYQNGKTGYQFIYDLNLSISSAREEFKRLSNELSSWEELFSGNTEIFSVIEGSSTNYLIQIRLSKKTADTTLVMIRIITK